MKTRLLPIATAIALSVSIASTNMPPVAAQAVAQTMADKAEPRFVYTGPLGVAGFQVFDLEGIPSDVTVAGVQVKGDFGYDSYAHTPAVTVSVNGNTGLTVNTNFRPASTDGTVGSEFEFVVTYSDGSASKFRQDIRFTPASQAEAFDPYFEDNSFEVGETTERKLKSVPKSAKVSVVDVPEGWSASVVKNNLLAVTAPDEATPISNNILSKGPRLEVSVVYPDGSSEVAEVSVRAVETEKPAQKDPSEDAGMREPTPNDSGKGQSATSSTGTIIGAVVAVLVVLGVGAFAVLNASQLRGALPF